MTESSPANPELAIVLPLGVVANQLMRIEADLRFLNMKALVFSTERDAGLVGRIAIPIERINQALDLIRSLVADIETDVRPNYSRPARVSSKESTSRERFPDRDD